VLIRVQCPHCKSWCQVDDRHVGATVKCGNCAKLFMLRSPSPAAALRSAEADDELPLELDGPEASVPEPQPNAPSPRASESCGVPVGAGCLDLGAATSAGQVRTRNEDSFLIQQLSWSNLDQRREMALVVVADGLGGHEAGDQASGIVIRTVGAALAPLLTDALRDSKAELSAARLSEVMGDALLKANRAVHAQAQKQPEWRGMGATVAAILVVDGQAVIGHVGDCRVYHHAGDKWRQITRDQTVVARMAELGQLSEAEARTHPSRHEVAQAVGRHPDLEPAIYEVKLATGDWLLAASDGLHAHVSSETLQDALSQTPSALALAHLLVRIADEAGGSDNCTVAAIRQC
jgi:protein phosphatase